MSFKKESKNFKFLKTFQKSMNSIYSHPLYPLLVVLFEKCELATSTPRETARDGSTSSDVCSSASFKDDLNEFVRHVSFDRQSKRENIPLKIIDT